MMRSTFSNFLPSGFNDVMRNSSWNTMFAAAIFFFCVSDVRQSEKKIVRQSEKKKRLRQKMSNSEEGPLFLGIFSPECWSVFVEGVTEVFTSPGSVLGRIDYYEPCALKVISKVLGFLIILGSFGFKLPQIFAVVSAKSAKGLSFTAMELDIFVFLASLGFSLRRKLPASAFGEQATVLAQNIALLLFARYYAKTIGLRLLLTAVAFLGACATIFYLPEQFVPFLPVIAVVASVASRLPQIFANYHQKHTGRLSTVTVALNVSFLLFFSRTFL